MPKAEAPSKKRRILRAVVVVLIVIAAGPEILIGLELVAMVDLLGVELFLSVMFGGVLWRITAVLGVINRFFERLDPFFFIPSRQQVVTYPGILVHAVPFLVTGCVFLYMASDYSATDYIG
jgi:hypothetical protein